MSAPAPDHTPAGPAYEGRLLPRPDDEVVDQGLTFDVTTMLNRRRMFKVAGLGFGALALAACSSNATSAGSTDGTSATSSGTTSSGTTSSGATSSGLAEIPDETNGPYPADGTNGVEVLTESGIVRSDIRSSFGDSTTAAEGVPFTFEFTVLNMAAGNAPYAGVAVYVWHCNRSGDYSLYSDAAKSENYLRGVQIADADGKVSFTSIYPACYSGRWPHVHFEVYPDQASITDHGNAISTSQMAVPKDVCDVVYATTGYEASVTNLSQVTLATDNVFGDDSAVHQLGTLTGDVTSGFHATLTVPVDTRTAQTGGNAPSGGGAGSPGGGGGGTPPSGGPGQGGTPPSGGPGGTPPSGAPGTQPSTSG